MSTSVLFYGWNRPVTGREKASIELFMEFQQYLGGLQQSGAIDSFENVLLSAHGGDLNGFTMVRGEITKLHELQRTQEWLTYMTRAGMIMNGGGLIPGVTGEGVAEWMALWSSLIPD
jgi:hypothetical protein